MLTRKGYASRPLACEESSSGVVKDPTQLAREEVIMDVFMTPSPGRSRRLQTTGMPTHRRSVQFLLQAFRLSESPVCCGKCALHRDAKNMHDPSPGHAAFCRCPVVVLEASLEDARL